MPASACPSERIWEMAEPTSLPSPASDVWFRALSRVQRPLCFPSAWNTCSCSGLECCSSCLCCSCAFDIAGALVFFTPTTNPTVIQTCAWTGLIGSPPQRESVVTFRFDVCSLVRLIFSRRRRPNLSVVPTESSSVQIGRRFLSRVPSLKRVVCSRWYGGTYQSI